jgi:molybdate transport system regulatory protein
MDVGIPAPDAPLVNLARIYATPTATRCLDSTQMSKLEAQFRSWLAAASRADVRASRQRILLVFLLIRYTGARLNEVLALDLRTHVDVARRLVRFGLTEGHDASSLREVQISETLISEIEAALADPDFVNEGGALLRVDAGHVRRKFYEQARECGFSQELGSPNAIRRSRAVELMQNNMPLPVVQRILGHSTPNLTAALVAFSDEDIHQVARHFIERESGRKTSARNTFFGKVESIRKGDIQSQVDVVTIGGNTVTTVITNNSLKRLGLKKGSFVTAEIKAPWVIMQKAAEQPASSAENLFHGTVTKVQRGKLTSEFIVRIVDGTELCSVVTEESRRKLGIAVGDEVWVLFNSFAVVLHVD